MAKLRQIKVGSSPRKRFVQRHTRAMVATYVLVHGAGHGGWCYQSVARLLRAEGHDIYTPTLTGLGERSHLLTPEVGLDTHIADVANLLFHEDLHDVILAGHSHGGIVITGAADIALDRVGQLVFLDAAILYDGESLAEVEPAATAFYTEAKTVNGVDLVLWPDEPIARSISGVEDEADWAWMRERLRPHPWRGFTDRLRLHNPEAVARLPRTVVNCTSTLRMRQGESLDRYHVGDRIWEIDTGHDLMITAPEKDGGNAVAACRSGQALTRLAGLEIDEIRGSQNSVPESP
jgi:pimeloyl-ACP methyl ester carboxylesterase